MKYESPPSLSLSAPNPRPAAGTANVRLPGHPEGPREHPRRPAAGEREREREQGLNESKGWKISFFFIESPLNSIAAHHRRTGRKRAQVRQGPERQPRRPEVHRVRRSASPPVHHRFLPGAGSYFVNSSSTEFPVQFQLPRAAKLCEFSSCACVLNLNFKRGRGPDLGETTMLR